MAVCRGFRSLRQFLPAAQLPGHKERSLAPITTLSFARYGSQRVWSLLQMQLGHGQLARVPGLRFYKLLGTGSGSGFSLWPDWDTYALLCVWEDLAHAQDFWKNSEFAALHGERALHRETFWLETLHAAGKWSGENPFPESKRKLSEHPVGVITRATLRASRLGEFWEAVPRAAKAIEEAQGVSWFKGIGELPWIQQATFSVWESQEAVRSFAYKSRLHADIVKKTRERSWYTEDLFARFAVVDHQVEELK